MKKYKFTVEIDGVETFKVEKPTIEMLEEEIGRYERIRDEEVEKQQQEEMIESGEICESEAEDIRSNYVNR